MTPAGTLELLRQQSSGPCHFAAREFAVVAFNFDENQTAAAPSMSHAAGFVGCPAEPIAGNRSAVTVPCGRTRRAASARAAPRPPSAAGAPPQALRPPPPPAPAPWPAVAPAA